MEKEIRYVKLDELTVRDADGEGRVEGYVNRFGMLSEDLGGFFEMTEKGAFARSVQANNVVALWQHNSADPIGRQDNGLLELREDSAGLWFGIKREAFSDRQFEKIADGTVRNMSFGFFTRSDRWETRDGKDVRILEDVDLLEVSPVTFAAYPDSSAAVRSLEQWRAEPNRDVFAERTRLDLERQNAELDLAECCE